MCLTGVDYFSTLGYQPAIAALAAGLLSPFATLVLVLLTLFGALPVYRRVAEESFHGSGSIAMLEQLLPWWAGKLFVLVLLGFAATDFMITITLSAADATAHAVENPSLRRGSTATRCAITLFLIALLGAVFLQGIQGGDRHRRRAGRRLPRAQRGRRGVARARSSSTRRRHRLVGRADRRSTATRWLMIGIALIVFPKLALGLSGFETGVAVMPQIKGDAGDTRAPGGPHPRRQRLLTTAAVS